MRRKCWYYLIACMQIGCLTSCSLSGNSVANREEPTGIETTGQRSETDSGGSHAGDEGGSAAADAADTTDDAVETAEGYQFVRGLGICAPGSPVIYQMENLNTRELKNEYGTVQLVNAFYQDGKVTLDVLFKDYSIYQLTDKEAREIQKMEKENMEKQERGESIIQDDSYFCVDEEKLIYGRSAFLESIEAEKSKDTPAPFKGKLYIQGSEKPGYNFTRTSRSYVYEDAFENGYVPSHLWMAKDAKYPETGGPGGVHVLQLNYFEEPFTFEFHKAPELSSLQELAGMTEQGGLSFYVEGESVEDKDGNTEELQPTFSFLRSRSGTTDIFTGISPWNLQKVSFQLPENPDAGKLRAVCKGFTVTDNTTIGTYTIPIPEHEEPLDIKAEFPGGILSVTKVSRMEEKIKVSTGQATDADRETEQEENSYWTATYYSDIDPGEKDDWHYGAIQGFPIAYEEGRESVTIRFHSASFQWDTDITVPVTWY